MIRKDNAVFNSQSLHPIFHNKEFQQGILVQNTALSACGRMVAQNLNANFNEESWMSFAGCHL